MIKKYVSSRGLSKNNILKKVYILLKSFRESRNNTLPKRKSEGKNKKSKEIQFMEDELYFTPSPAIPSTNIRTYTNQHWKTLWISRKENRGGKWKG